MNCATHSDTAAVAFCRTCGKPLCNQCTRDVRGVIYCESCLAARMEGTAPAAGFVPPAQTVYPPFRIRVIGMKVGGPGHPSTRARIPQSPEFSPDSFPSAWAQFILGSMPKGLAHPGHLGAADFRLFRSCPGTSIMVLGIGIGFFYVYQIIDAVRSARAIADGRARTRSIWPGANLQHGREVRRHESSRRRRRSDWPGRAVPVAHHRLFEFGLRSFLAADSDLSRRLAVCQTLGTDRRHSTVLRLRTLPHAQADGAGDAGHHGHAFPARQRFTHRLSPHLARHPAGDWSRETDAEQCFVRRTRRAAASGRVRRVFRRSPNVPPPPGAADCAAEPQSTTTSSGEVNNV